jgi:serine/threonine protein kinase
MRVGGAETPPWRTINGAGGTKLKIARIPDCPESGGTGSFRRMSQSGNQFDELRDALRPHYALERELGRGGMATVYLATDEREQRRVALKVLHPAFSADVGTDRFLREIQLASRLSHPNILPLLDSGRVGDVPFYVMPWVDGETLSQRLERERLLSVGDAAHIAFDVLAALGHAHADGVLHRDIKPDNIMLGGGRAFVADFGIGKAITGSDHASLTRTGTALGTPAYMSLEQAAGDPDLDARSDLYSFGLVLYEMLSGSTPFAGDTPQAVIAARFIHPVQPLGPSVPGVTGAVDEVLLRALARQREDRFASADEFARALRDATGLTA